MHTHTPQQKVSNLFSLRFGLRRCYTRSRPKLSIQFLRAGSFQFWALAFVCCIRNLNSEVANKTVLIYTIRSGYSTPNPLHNPAGNDSLKFRRYRRTSGTKNVRVLHLKRSSLRENPDRDSRPSPL